MEAKCKVRQRPKSRSGQFPGKRFSGVIYLSDKWIGKKVKITETTQNIGNRYIGKRRIVHRCPRCGNTNTVKKGRTYLKNVISSRGHNWRQKCFCKDCNKDFTAIKGLVGKIYGMKKHHSRFKEFCIATDRLQTNHQRITSRIIKKEMGILGKSISHVTINDWLNKIYPNIKRVKNQF